MTREETLKVLGTIDVAYPETYRNFTREKYKRLAELWQSAFADIDGTYVLSAVTAFIESDTKGYAPKIGQIKNILGNRFGDDELTEQEAWALVRSAVSRSGYDSVEEFNKLPPIIQQIIRTPRTLHDWALSEVGEVDSVIASNFQRSYRAKLQTLRFNNCLSEKTKQALGISDIKPIEYKKPEVLQEPLKQLTDESRKQTIEEVDKTIQELRNGNFEEKAIEVKHVELDIECDPEAFQKKHTDLVNQIKELKKSE